MCSIQLNYSKKSYNVISYLSFNNYLEFIADIFLHITYLFGGSTDSPRSPSIEIPADLLEKTSVSITCSAPTPCPHSPPELTWNLQADSQRQTETNTDGSFTTKIQKTITLSDTHDGFTIRCSARYPVNEGPPKTAETLKTLSVSYAPKNTSASISPSGSVSAGICVKMTFSWFRSSTDGDQKVAEGEFYSLNPAEGGAFYCVATSDLGNQTSGKIDLIVEVRRASVDHSRIPEDRSMPSGLCDREETAAFKSKMRHDDGRETVTAEV
ncbi:vascular cell adhesion protein 1-like [Oryzias melastigma]|uniref:vascular cell adhesion protein 1-like n=1 Tax=Oryzias melastigma TaxID=30732 RepID=UPI00168D0CCE|nr:vascular cell adhesion protein 1-like [Oryzias melastigma]